MRSRWRGRLLKTTAVIGVLATAAWAAWPALLEGYARRQVEDALGRRFESVQMSCFDLRRDGLTMCDLVLERGDARVEVVQLETEFDLSWGSVSVTSISARGGSVAGELATLEELRGSGEGAGISTGRSSRLLLEKAALEAEDIQLDLRQGEHSLTGWARASAEEFAGPIDVALATVEVRRGDRLLGGAASVETSLDPSSPFPLVVHIEKATASPAPDLAVRDVGGTLTISSETLERAHADLAGATEGGQKWSFRGDVDRAAKTVSASFTADDITPGQLPGVDSLPLVPDEGRLSVDLSLNGSTRQMLLAGTVELKGVLADHPRLARGQVPIHAEIELRGVELDLDSQSLRLEGASISRGDISVEVSGEINNAGDPELRQFAAHLTMPTPSPCQGVLEALPRELVPGLEGFRLEGTAELDLRVHVDMADPDATVLEGGLDIDRCRIREVPQAFDAISGPFTHVVRMKNGRTATRLMGRGAPYFAAIDELPIHVHAAVVASEDGGFWRHDGFLEKQIRASLRRNVETGEFRRGGSTITMQMVKNVLLSHEKTLSRKLQELFLTWAVERSLSKDRIIELYLNAVEFGPGIYGIGHAAEHYFGKQARDLSSLESAFLATLLPRPVERHEFWCRGEVPPKHMAYVRAIHRRMLAKHAVSKEDFDAAEDQGIIFSRAQWRGEEVCLADGRSVEAGRHAQEAISGLLSERVEFGR